MTQAPLMDRIHITEDYDVPRVINGGWQLSAGHALERPLDLADASLKRKPKTVKLAI